MWIKSIKNILGMGIFGSCFLAASLPVQAQIMIQGGNLSGNLNYDYNNPIVPIYNGLTGLDINSFNLETDIGRISNFQGTGQLKEVSNLGGIFQNGQAPIGTLSGLITGRSQTADGNFLLFNNTPITINGVVSSLQRINDFTQVGNIAITGGKIDTNLLTNLTQPGAFNFGTNLTNLGAISNLGRTAAERFSLPQLGFNPQFIQTLINNPNYGRIGSTGLTTIPGLPSRIYPGLTALSR
ncbi:MAG: hypothetical protein HCA25_18265 [Dolichospermum sp. DET50]|nr:hypothetical protein [Dolichospermum sp. DET66]MBS3034158.1 hypothetical protein [Dolichospermum sp. DET67]MBS3039361.1 hypothetical protein [Dolichospermum sp. DET50]QSX66585.1 MAG: hypothetical protein EZY12_17530 [Dolichospermum sp. DET69]